ncbi:MAG: ATP-dependent helicase [Lachnospiraceae bacterium]|nr:ATP-dependent helicase [Candidatus Minthocola equi]
MQLNESQLAATLVREGPALIVAGPGSGKTAVITQRIHTLIDTYGVAPETILVITFTRAAAAEMQARFQKLTGDAALPVTFGTFHSVFLHILKRTYGNDAFDIAGEDDELRTLSMLVKDIQSAPDSLAKELLDEFSRAKNMNEKPRSVCGVPAKRCAHLMQQLDERIAAQGLISFDDMISRTYKLLRERPDILRKWHNIYRYILIDEFQDINEPQYRTVKLLAGNKPNLFVVGDDDQAIYGFRGSTPGIMKKFAKEYKSCKVIYLSKNYRSDEAIVEMSANLISHNHNRFKKKLSANREYKIPPVVRSFDTLTEENRFICEEIKSLISRGHKLSDIAVLYRTNATERSLLEQMKKEGLPFESDCDMSSNDDGPKVTVSTMHKSKGLEYRAVFVPDVIEGLVPHKSIEAPEEIEEERRLFYVAITRAKSRLYVLTVKRRYNREAVPSRFISEMYKKRFSLF